MQVRHRIDRLERQIAQLPCRHCSEPAGARVRIVRGEPDAQAPTRCRYCGRTKGVTVVKVLCGVSMDDL
jgi:hypothetical protein